MRKKETPVGNRREENLAQRDPSKLTNLNPSKESISQNNQTGIAIHSVEDSGTDSESGSSSPFPPEKSERHHKANLDNDDDDLLEGFAFTPDQISLPPLELSTDIDMSEETKSNQQESADVLQSQQEDLDLLDTPPEDNNISQEHEPCRQREFTGADQVAVQEGDINQKGAPILTVEAYNEIVKASGEGMPLFRHKTRMEFFKSKEANYLREMGKFKNDDGSFPLFIFSIRLRLASCASYDCTDCF